MNAWLILAGSILCNVAGNLLMKRFAATVEIHGLRDYIAPSFAMGIAAFGIGVLLYGSALSRIPIVIAYPIQVGACLVTIATVAVAGFGERLGWTELFGIALIVAGIILLARVAA